jgi:hypothetical protein
MTFPFFFIIAHIKFYFIIRIAFWNVVDYKTLNTRLDLSFLVINPSKPKWGPRCTFTFLPLLFPPFFLMLPSTNREA